VGFEGMVSAAWLDAERFARDAGSGWETTVWRNLSCAVRKVKMPAGQVTLRAWPAKEGSEGWWCGSARTTHDVIEEWYAPRGELAGRMADAEHAFAMAARMDRCGTDARQVRSHARRLSTGQIAFLIKAMDECSQDFKPTPTTAAVLYMLES
jgi:hypothetical protein